MRDLSANETHSSWRRGGCFCEGIADDLREWKMERDMKKLEKERRSKVFRACLDDRWRYFQATNSRQMQID